MSLDHVLTAAIVAAAAWLFVRRLRKPEAGCAKCGSSAPREAAAQCASTRRTPGSLSLGRRSSLDAPAEDSERSGPGLLPPATL